MDNNIHQRDIERDVVLKSTEYNILLKAGIPDQFFQLFKRLMVLVGGKNIPDIEQFCTYAVLSNSAYASNRSMIPLAAIMRPTKPITGDFFEAKLRTNFFELTPIDSLRTEIIKINAVLRISMTQPFLPTQAGISPLRAHLRH